jgi:hypothetical protein
MLHFKKFKLFFFSIFILFKTYACQEAEYTLDNPSDPENIDLEPPALFFHPPEIDVKKDTEVSVQIYGLDLPPASAAHIKIGYERTILEYVATEANEFFTGDNDPVVIDVHVPDEGNLDIFLYYLPDLDSNQSQGGTWSLATIYFTTGAEGESYLEFDTEITELRDFNNNSVLINEFGEGKINVD